MENKRAHLEMIQGIINRMAGNLFFLKGWAITLIAALFALSAKDSNPKYVIIAYFPVVVFWILDGYFLSQERRFRALYDSVRKLDEKEIDFSMKTGRFKSKDNNWWYSMFSITLSLFYVPLVVTMVVVTYLLK